ncbi:HlyU family transcriptional regulator [Rhizobium tubonense]|uniref:Transcriptional activator HlyU n=1 Tax=Rhizobium tubonense TaxID=484088 RepID=A0A2W4CCZ2_9HYPH|nr:HlyU family transcriptional regulator [Rhizobium tubonense]PZM11139.1 transcriptional activator HlyU [Rhizobium tubonense]
MASIISKILGVFSGSGSSAGSAKAPVVAATEPQLYADCKIFATPQREGNQFRLAGRIEKQVNGETLVRNFIRADVFTSVDDAVETTFRKAQQIIDQHGASLFGDGEKSRQV